jgi:hypothetical protein
MTVLCVGAASFYDDQSIIITTTISVYTTFFFTVALASCIRNVDSFSTLRSACNDQKKKKEKKRKDPLFIQCLSPHVLFFLQSFILE